MRYISSILIILLFSLGAFAQNTTLRGRVSDEDNAPLMGATVSVKGTGNGTVTDSLGYYILKIPRDKDLTLTFQYVGHDAHSVAFRAQEAQEYLNVSLRLGAMCDTCVVIKTDRIPVNSILIDPKNLAQIPSPSGNVESLLLSFGLGVRAGTGGELSAQYSVRGGNYDENLIYVNGFEVYRPFLIRTGQQEGLTFPNMDMIRNMSFSSGGFEANYGDKMSSVLDIEYKRPDSLAGSVSASFLGATAHIEGAAGNRKRAGNTYKPFKYMVGARYKTTQYLLGSLETTGEYTPQFGDIQAYMSYDITSKWRLDYIGNFNRSFYQLVPEETSTTLGLISNALKFNVYYQGQEITDFTTGMSGVSATYVNPTKNYFLKWLASGYHSQENERFDLLGYYQIGQVETDLSKDNAGEIISVLGDGIEHKFGRNYLTAKVINLEHKGGLEIENADKSNGHFIQWGLKAQSETIKDELNEWTRSDSAGYSLPFDDDEVRLDYVLKAKLNANSMRYSAFAQDTWSMRKGKSDLNINFGVRASYWDFNKEVVVSPRFLLSYIPNRSKDLGFKLAGGLYQQPPFYRELRGFNGQLNNNVLAQKSAHIVLGSMYKFKWLNNKKFTFITEAYYKHLWDLIPYDLDNVKIRYYASNNMTGYATGIDFRLNGEFVPGAESWINLSFLRTREKIEGVQHMNTVAAYETTDGIPTVTTANNAPRPTDQLVSLSLFFQDNLPKNPNLKMHLNTVVASGQPYGYPNKTGTFMKGDSVFRNSFRFLPYYRVDIGFSAMLWDRKKREKRGLSSKIENAWASLEVFNLLQVKNQASVTWVRTIFNRQFAVPNRLTSRRINLRFRVNF